MTTPAKSTTKATPRKTTGKRGPGKPVSAEHKKALAQGREEARAVNTYMALLDQARPKRGRKVSKESLQQKLETARRELRETTGVTKILAAQAVLDLEARLSTEDTVVDISQAEKDFIKVLPSYSARRGISYQAWRTAGVPAEVLKQAKITRGKSQSQTEQVAA